MANNTQTLVANAAAVWNENENANDNEECSERTQSVRGMNLNGQYRDQRHAGNSLRLHIELTVRHVALKAARQ